MTWKLKQLETLQGILEQHWNLANIFLLTLVYDSIGIILHFVRN